MTTGLLKYYMNKRQGGVETEATIEEKTVEVAGDVYVFRAIVLTREN
ncbi:MAG: hypothetical protein ABEI11_01170 [Haloarculaceae archaeon]